MNSFKPILNKIGVIGKYRAKLVLGIAIVWTIIDTAFFIYKFYIDHIAPDPHPFDMRSWVVLLLRSILILFICLVMAYLLVYELKQMVRNLPLWLSLVIKIIALLVAAFILNFLLHFTYIWLIEKQPLDTDLGKFYYKIFQTSLFFNQMMRWLAIFLVTILYIEVNEKYSPGVFFRYPVRQIHQS